jgi:hypothetical protein
MNRSSAVLPLNEDLGRMAVIRSSGLVNSKENLG